MPFNTDLRDLLKAVRKASRSVADEIEREKQEFERPIGAARVSPELAERRLSTNS